MRDVVWPIADVCRRKSSGGFICFVAVQLLDVPGLPYAPTEFTLKLGCADAILGIPFKCTEGNLDHRRDRAKSTARLLGDPLPCVVLQHGRPSEHLAEV